MSFTKIKKSSQAFLFCLLSFAFFTPPIHAEEKYINDSQKIFEIIDRWAEAWINLDADTYIDYYSRNYKPDKTTSHRTWASERRNKFSVQKWVKLGITGVVISKRDEDSYSVNFKQRYKSDSFRDTVRKELIFIREKSTWRISSEKIIGH